MLANQCIIQSLNSIFVNSATEGLEKIAWVKRHSWKTRLFDFSIGSVFCLRLLSRLQYKHYFSFTLSVVWSKSFSFSCGTEYCPEMFGVSFGQADYGEHLPFLGAAEESANRLVARHFAKKQFHTRQRLSFHKTASLKGKLDAWFSCGARISRRLNARHGGVTGV